MSTDISAQLNEIARVLGRVEGKLDSTISTLSQHVEDDKELTRDVRTLQLGAARQRGALTVLGAVGSMLGAGVGYLVERWIGGGHHG